MINKELKSRLEQLQEPNRSILTDLIEKIELNTQKQELSTTTRSKIREYVTMEMKK